MAQGAIEVVMLRRTALVGFVLALAGCGGSGADFAPFDPGSADLSAPDVPVLNDAVVLEIRTGDLSAQEVVESPDAAVLDPGDGTPDTSAPEDSSIGPSEVVGVEDAPSPADLPAPGDSYGPDLPPTDEGGHPPPCGDRARPCEEGTACVTDSDGSSYCAPIAECSGKGAIDLEELVTLLTTGEGQIHVKVLAMAWPGKPACSPLPCPPDRPCCNTCFAPLFIGAETFPIVLNGHGTTIGCQGNECDVLDGCRPFTLSSWYWVWGTAGIVGGKAQLTVDGFCPADFGAGS